MKIVVKCLKLKMFYSCIIIFLQKNEFLNDTFLRNDICNLCNYNERKLVNGLVHKQKKECESSKNNFNLRKSYKFFF